MRLVGAISLRQAVQPKVAIEPGSPPMPVIARTGHALLQIVTVALGSPLGREVASREIGDMLAGWFSRANPGR
jgi:H+/Cl- antiporter ClcA